MDELEAINMMLRLIGSNPVNDVETSQPDVFNARATLKRNRKKIQKRGWWCNVDYNVIFQPDPSTGIITVGSEITSFIPYRTDSYIVRDNKLYDRINQTYVFTENITAYKLIRTLEWDEMPDSMQETVGYMAAAEFIRDELEDAQKQANVEQDVKRARKNLDKENLTQGQPNMFNSARRAAARGGVQPYRAGRYRQQNFDT